MNGFYQFKLPALFQDYEYNALLMQTIFMRHGK